MKLKAKISAILILLVIAVCSLFAACQVGGEKWQQTVGDARTQYITYYAGGGMFDDNADKVVKDIYYTAGTPTMGADAVVSSLKLAKTDWLFKAWYYVECDAEGNPVFASEEDKKAGIPVLTDREVVFPLTLQKDEHLYLGAKWARDYKIKYFLHEDSPDITVGGKVYKAGDELKDDNFGAFDSKTLSYSPTQQPVNSSDATLLEYYVKNEAGEYEVPAEYRIVKPTEYSEGDEEPFVAVYCKFVKGLWTMVRTASDVSDMYGNLASGGKYYITQDINCADNPQLTLKVGAINCEIEGNGFTISNQKFQRQNLSLNLKCSIFGELSESTVIRNITFENIEVKVTSIPKTRVSVYLFSHGIQSGATLENVNINGSTLDISKVHSEATIENIPKTVDGDYLTDSWIYADGDYSGVAYDNLTLKINDVTLVPKN